MKLNNVGTQSIITNRLKLKRFEVTDIDDMLKNWISIEEVQHNYGEPIYKTHDEVNDILNKWISSYSTNKEFYRWAITLKDCGTNIGQIAFYKVNSRDQNLEVEYCIGPEFSGNNYATEALLAVIEYAFEELKYNRVQAFHRRKNPSSGKVLEKAGMKYEGMLKDYLIHNGEFDDCIMYTILKREWNK